MKDTVFFVLILVFACATGCGEAPPGESSPAPPAAGSPGSQATGSLSEQVKREYQQQIERDQRAFLEAVSQGDSSTLMKFMHPKLIEALGGADEMTRVLANGIEVMESSGMTATATFPKPAEYIKTEGRLFAVVPLTITTTIEGKAFEVNGCQVGILEKGTTEWKYVDLSKLDPETVKQLFPDFPADYPLPQSSVREL